MLKGIAGYLHIHYTTVSKTIAGIVPRLDPASLSNKILRGSNG